MVRNEDYTPRKDEIVAPDRPWNPAPDFMCISNEHRLGSLDKTNLEGYKGPRKKHKEE